MRGSVGPCAATSTDTSSSSGSIAARSRLTSKALLEHHDAARDLACHHAFEPFVDVGELVGAADQAVDVQPLVHVVVDQHGKIEVGPHRAVEGAAHRLLGEYHHEG